MLKVTYGGGRRGAIVAAAGTAVAMLLGAPAAAGFGSVESEGPALTNATGWQSVGIVGEDIKVAVIDNDFSDWTNKQIAREIPNGVPVQDYAVGDFEDGSTSHGTRVAEQIMDMAPRASLHAIRVDSASDMTSVRGQLDDWGIDVAVMAMASLATSFHDGTGPVNQQIENSRLYDGVFWVVGAGNWRLGHLEGVYPNKLFSAFPEVEDGNYDYTLVWNQFPQSIGRHCHAISTPQATFHDECGPVFGDNQPRLKKLFWGCPLRGTAPNKSVFQSGLWDDGSDEDVSPNPVLLQQQCRRSARSATDARAEHPGAGRRCLLLHRDRSPGREVR